MKKLILLMTMQLATFSASAAPAGFLFVTFRGEANPMTEQIYFALSKDGRDWTALNDGKPVLVSQLGEKGVRDPYLLRAADGKKFYLIATDLSIALNRNWGRAVHAGSQSIVVWESSDLVNWSEPWIVKVAPDDAGCTWAPEAIYDPESRRYLVYWASTTKGDDFKKQRIWGAWTKDFKTFSAPFVYIEKPTTIIDTDIVHGDDGKYYRFTKDEKFKAITMEMSNSISGKWTEVPDFSLAKLVGYEGPECYMVEPASPGKPATWCLILDFYSKGLGYQPFVTNDLSRGQFKPGEGFRFPFPFRHGSILPLTQDEYRRIENKWGPQPAASLKSSAGQVKKTNVLVDLEKRTIQLPVKPGTDLTRLDPLFSVEEGAAITPSGPQDFSRGPVAYTVRSKDAKDMVLQVSAAVHRNPVLDGLYADPDILWSEKTKRFYIYPTSDGFHEWSGSSFKVFSSPDLVEWKDEGVILDLPKDAPWGPGNAWAPCIIEKKTADGYRYYYYFTAAKKIGVAVADNPTGPFKDTGKPLVDGFPPGVTRGQQIDPAVFCDPKTGKNYLFWGNAYLAAAELNDDMVSLKLDTLKILTPDKTYCEGSTVFYRNGKYYLLWSENDTRSPDYRVRYATAPSPLGPFTVPKDNLVIAKDPSLGIYGTGHNSVLQMPGRDEWYIVYHRFNYPKGITTGREAGYNREACIDRMNFDADGNILPVHPTHEGVAPRIDPAAGNASS